MIYLIDLFCGAGGVSSGASRVSGMEIIACVNHDANAIKSHAANHPNCKHYTEDIRTLDLSELKAMVLRIRRMDPDAKIAVWASLECTHFSKAKGGQSRNADSRTLAEHLFRYYDALDPDFIWIENVREFLTWGPLDKNDKPDKNLKGTDYEKWVDEFRTRGYSYDYKLLNAADYGAFTSRLRYFGQFSKDPDAIVWPKQTHFKKPTKLGQRKWNAVKKVLNFSNEGISIFKRKKRLSDATFHRVYSGLIKFVANGDTSFIKRYNGGNPMDKVSDVNTTIGTISTNCRHALVQCDFLYSYYGNSTLIGNSDPCGTITTKDRFAKVNVQFIDNQYGQSGATSIDDPLGTVTANPKQNVVTCDRWLLMPQFSSKGSSLEAPCFTLIARMDKTPPYLLQADKGTFNLDLSKYFDDLDIQYIVDTEANVYGPRLEKSIRIKIIEFMIEYGISDIKMRMLEIIEMLQIQGFPKDYILEGTQTEQKKYIGNAVEVNQAFVLLQTIASKNNPLKQVA